VSVDGERKTEILETAATLFASSGLRTSLKEIADACGILPGSLYHHFTRPGRSASPSGSWPSPPPRSRTPATASSAAPPAAPEPLARPELGSRGSRRSAPGCGTRNASPVTRWNSRAGRTWLPSTIRRASTPTARRANGARSSNALATAGAKRSGGRAQRRIQRLVRSNPAWCGA
jgi:Bacterial regulatory proteins, tetR family